MMAAAFVKKLYIDYPQATEYCCIRCKDPVCHSEFEKDDSTDGWIVGKSVAYCKSCIISGSDEYDRPKEYENVTETGHSSTCKNL